MLNGHLDEETLLLLTTGELDVQWAAQAGQHLAGCAVCRKKFKRASSFRRHLREALQQQDQPIFKNSFEPHRPSSFRWIAAAAGIAAIVSWTLIPHSLQAKDILDRAMLAETRASAFPRQVRVRAGDASCPVGTLPLARVSTACTRLNHTVHSLPWDWQHPLSVRAFRGWRDRLTGKSDTVRQNDGAIVVTTASADGPIRSAELTLSASDYHATRTVLRLENLPTVEISEEQADADLWASASAKQSGNTSESDDTNAPADDPADAAEVSAWLVLGRLKLLDGWKATLHRSGESVQVIAGLDWIERQELLEKLRPLHIDTSAIALAGSVQSPMQRFTPRRESFSQSPALGRDWVRKTLPSGMNATVLTNDLLSVSQRVLGQATLLDLLRARKAALRNCACAAQLTRLLREQDESLAASTAQLIALLTPLFSPTGGGPPLFTGLAAHHLDTALLHVFASGPAHPGTLEEELSCIEELLHLHARSQ